MADGRVEIDIELIDTNAKSEAGKAGKAAGKEFEASLEAGAKGAGDAIAKETAKTKAPAKADGKAAGEAYAASFTESVKGLGGKVIGAAGIGAAIGGAFASVETANEFQEDMGKLEVAFGSAGYSAETAGEIYRDFVGILGETDQSVEAVNHLAELASSEEELAEWGTIAAGVYAKFGDSLPIEGLTEAANETAKVGQVTGPLADALNWAGQSEDEFNAKLAALSTEEERAALITDTLSGMYEDAGNAYLEANEGVVEYRQGQSDLQAAMSGVGETLMPLVTKFIELGAEIVDNLQPAIQWLIDNMDRLAPIVGALVGGFISFKAALAISAIIQGVSSAMSALKLATEGTTVAQALMNTVMKANPMVMIVTVIGTLVAAFATLMLTNDEFRAKVEVIWNYVKTLAAGVFGGIVTIFTEKIPDAIGKAIDWFKQLPEKAGEFIQQLADKIAELPGKALEIGKNIVEGLWDGINSMISWVLDKVSGFAGEVIGGIKSVLGINSPSKVMRDEVGKFMAQGIYVGFEAENPIRKIQASLSRGVSSLSLAAQVSGGASYSSTTMNFNQPIQSAAQMARMMRMQQTYGLAGAR